MKGGLLIFNENAINNRIHFNLRYSDTSNLDRIPITLTPHITPTTLRYRIMPTYLKVKT